MHSSFNLYYSNSCLPCISKLSNNTWISTYSLLSLLQYSCTYSSLIFIAVLNVEHPVIERVQLPKGATVASIKLFTIISGVFLLQIHMILWRHVRRTVFHGVGGYKTSFLVYKPQLLKPYRTILNTRSFIVRHFVKLYLFVFIEH